MSSTNDDSTKFEEEKQEDDQDGLADGEEAAGSGALYDKDLFAQELGDLVDEDVDFD